MAAPAVDETPRWMYVVGVAAIFFVILVWDAPLEWLTDVISGRIRDDLNDLTPSTTVP